MGGLYSALNIAKNSLLAFQMGVHVTGHNVANVDTEGYSRQKTINAPYPPTPGPAGPMGSGVKVEQIKRYFDAFLEANLNLKKSDLGLLAAEDTGLDLIQGLFNETNPLGLGKLLDDFFTSWQGLSNRAEGIPERRVVVEKGRVLAEAIRDKAQALVDLENNVRLKLKDVVNEINEIARQIAEINRQITAAESGLHQANDLRDQRDRLVAKLSELAQVRYFENNQGAYAVVLGNGYNLVDIDSYWELELSGGEVYWRGHSGEKVRLTSREVSQGKLGGWLRIIEQISEDWNHEYVISTRPVFTREGHPLRENITWEELGLESGKIKFSGRNHYGDEITGAYEITDTSQTIRDFLNEIEKAYDYKVQAYLTEDGRLVVKDAVRGGGKLSFTITEGPLDFGRFDDEAANHRVEELNLTGKFHLLAEELIRSVNEIHTEGVGLKFYEGELKGLFHSDGSIKGLPFFRDLKRDGTLFLWLKNPEGKITPVRVEFELPAHATIGDIANQINEALDEAGFDPRASVMASFRDGRLVFQAQEGWGFAFSNDTANVLLATGINVFFAGSGAGSIAINEKLSVNPEYLAAARLDREAWRSERPLAASYRSRLPIDNPASKVFNDPPHRIYVRFFDENGNQILHETENGFRVKELGVEINPGDTLEEILGKLDALEGLRAYFDGEGHIVLELDPNSSKNYAYFELGTDEPPPVDSFLSYLREKGVWVPQYQASGGRTESDDWFDNPSLVRTSEEVELNFVFRDAEGRETGRTSLSVPNNTNLEALADLIDALPELRAGFTEGNKGKLFIALENAPEGSVTLEMTVSGGDGDGVIDLSSGGALTFSSVSEKQIFSGLEPLVKPTQYTVNLGGADPENLEFSGLMAIRFFDENGNEISNLSFASDSSYSGSIIVDDNNSNGRKDLEDLVQKLDEQPEMRAYLDNGELVIALDDGAPAGTAYFVIEGNDPARSWGGLEFLNRASDAKENEYLRLPFRMGALENWLFDGAGNPIDADPENEIVDPFRLELSTDAGAIQIVRKYNAEENARFGLSAHLDDQGRLVVKTSGLYDTRSFVVRDAFPKKSFFTTLSANHFEAATNTWYLLTDKEVNKNALFHTMDSSGSNPQFITVKYLTPDNNSTTSAHIFLRRSEESVSATNSLDDPSATVSFTFYSTADTAYASPLSLTFSAGDTVNKVVQAIDDLKGLHAELSDDGKILISLRTDEFDTGDPRKEAAYFTISVTDTSDSRLTFNGTSINFFGSARLKDYMAEINALDQDGDGISDFSATIDDSGRLSIKVNDPDLDQDGSPDWVRFSLESSLTSEEGNLVTYLSRRIYIARDHQKGLVSALQGFSPAPGDNRNALRLAALSDSRRERLGQASVADFYTALVGEVGIAAKTVKNSKSFMEDLINQLQIMRDSISGVSLDEEMANLIKYQQAFAASAKILTVADEMLDTLIQAKR